MAQMSKKFLDMGAEVYVDQAVGAKKGNKALRTSPAIGGLSTAARSAQAEKGQKSNKVP